MNYEILTKNFNIHTVKQDVLKNRGIIDVETYLNLSENNLIHYSRLDNINNGVKLLLSAIANKTPIKIIVDSDFDGYASASAIFCYIRDVMQYDNLEYLLHEKKHHGLTDDMICYFDGCEKSLIIIPDGGTNDSDQCCIVAEKQGHDILIIDHHEKDVENNYAMIINNKACGYQNKELCGTGIVYKFLQALDDELWENGADQYLDLVALANIADIVDLRIHETRYLVAKGLYAIEHPFIKAIIDARSFSIKNTSVPTINDIAFYVSPVVNAITRIGTMEEKQKVFRAFIKDDSETFEYQPRRKSKDDPKPDLIQEDIYKHASRVAINAKARQDKSKKKYVDEIIANNLTKNKDRKIFVASIDDFDSDFSGVLANEIASRFNMPCILLKNNDDGTYSGSGRCPNYSYVSNLKQEIEQTGLAQKIGGHSSAFGLTIVKHNIDKLISYFDYTYANVSNEKVYRVDFEFEEEVPFYVVQQINDLKPLFCNTIEESLILIKNISLSLDDISILGDEKKYFKFMINDIEFIKFNIGTNDVVYGLSNQWLDKDEIVLNVIGKVNLNMYGNVLTPQIIIEEYEVKPLDSPMGI